MGGRGVVRHGLTRVHRGVARGPLSVLGHRTFAVFWAGAFLANIGAWMRLVGVGIFITEATGKATWAAAIAVVTFGPSVVIMPIAGAVADGPRRKQVVMAAMSIQTIASVALSALVVGGWTNRWLVVGAVLLGGIGNAIGRPAIQSIVSDIVPESDLVAGLGLMSVQFSLARIFGPVFVGLALVLAGDHWGYVLTFGVPSACFLAVVPLMSRLHIPVPARRPRIAMWRQMAQGLRYCVGDPGIRFVMLYLTLASLLLLPYLGLVSPMALDVIKVGKTGNSVMVAAQGVGSTLAALCLASLHRRFGQRRVLHGVLWILPIVVILYSQADNLFTGSLGLFAGGALFIVLMSTNQAIAQLRTAPEMRGRMLGTMGIIDSGVYVVGVMIHGAIADHVGLRATTATGAALMLVALVIVRVSQHRHLHALDAVPRLV